MASNLELISLEEGEFKEGHKNGYCRWVCPGHAEAMHVSIGPFENNMLTQTGHTFKFENGGFKQLS